MDDRIARELRLAIDRHAANPELHELWLRVLGLQLLVENDPDEVGRPKSRLHEPFHDIARAST
jgi:hypothetical protein